MLQSQREIEEIMYYGGIKRATGMMEKAESAGRAVQNPYAKELLGEYVLPLAELIRKDITGSTGAGKRRAHVILLRALDPEVIAFHAVRVIINSCLTGDDKLSHLRALSYHVGKTIHRELVLEQIATEAPELYQTLHADLGRRMSKDERHRMTVFKLQAKEKGLNVVEWPLGACDQVGLYLVDLLLELGLVEVEPERRVHNKVLPRQVTLQVPVMQRINEIKGHIAVTMPVYGPCVEPPRDWVTPNDGGFHTRELRRTHPTLVRHQMARSAHFRDAVMPTVLDAANALQRTAWAVNGRMLEIIRAVAPRVEVGELGAIKERPKPPAPEWLPEEWVKTLPREQWPEAKLAEFKQWKHAMAEWYTARKLAGVKFGRFYAATRSADMFKDYPAIHFVYFADSRGRLYPMTYGVNPQGSDLQKALLHFAEGKPLDTPEAIRWFHVQGANKWGFDKAPLAERHAWVVERQDLLLSFAEDPLNNTGWTEAGDPLQFLAWCLEYRDYVLDASGNFLSRIPISMDGSCNGLQNLSAVLRDEIGGKATNLIPAAQMEDIYRRVAEAALLRMSSMTYDDLRKERLRQMWLQHGITRSYVKRAVMTTPYGVTKRSAIDYVVQDTLARGEGPPFEKADRLLAAQVLMDSAWPAIGDIVVKGVVCMEWLKKGARSILRHSHDQDDPCISWVSPSGFPAIQTYWEITDHRINTRLAGGTKIRVPQETDSPDFSEHASGLAPNFVHSLDAAHLHLTASAARSAGIDALAMIHDDYGTHAANAQQLYEIIREQFVRMYEEHDPIGEFYAKYPRMGPPPEKGSLDIRGVLDSDYFFS